MSRNAQLDAWSILISVVKCLSINHLIVTLGLAFVYRLSFSLGLEFVSLRKRVRRTLYDLYFTYFLPEKMVRFTRTGRGFFVMLI